MPKIDTARLAGIDHHGQHLTPSSQGLTIPAGHAAVVHGYGTINGGHFNTEAFIESHTTDRTATLQVWYDDDTPKARINLVG